MFAASVGGSNLEAERTTMGAKRRPSGAKVAPVGHVNEPIGAHTDRGRQFDGLCDSAKRLAPILRDTVLFDLDRLGYYGCGSASVSSLKPDCESCPPCVR
jgi:hypothetical protein